MVGDLIRRAGGLRSVRCIAVVALALVGGCKAPPLVEGNVPASTISSDFDWSAYTLGTGDIVNVTVFAHPELSTREAGQRVDLVGALELPLVGAIEVADLTLEEARLRVREALAEYLTDPSVTLSVVEYGSRRVYLLGMFSKPGAYVLDRPLTALQALAYGGTLAPGADRETIALIRTRADQIEAHYFDAATPGVDGLVAVEPGDVIFVRQSGAGKFSEQILPYLNGVAPVVGTLTNVFLIAEALSDD